ncbi:GABA permease [Blastomyces gilchristii SLH14081]|uniref:GABA permease n=1 Tax=Blastomyces gilchristii (strain SLH14081) TaxID=559298 RepID=A0A179US68_BLAGS|nr:GABA permease [Blastomyces gilchristii SLH14081]OAT10936.1 GABA permease [Blastomyces gilchristii SLH14081]
MWSRIHLTYSLLDQLSTTMATTTDGATQQASAKGSSPQESMYETPDQYDMDDIEDSLDDGAGDEIVRRGHTKNDRKDMNRMGKRQELIRNYRPLSALSFALILQATWEFMLISNTEGLINGGLAGLFWSYLWTFIGFGFVIFSLAEMASMAPISGGQYHWVSEFASEKHQKFLSYITGWLSVLAWQAGAASGSFLTGNIIQGLLTVNKPDYEATPWRGTLLVFAMVALIYVFNIWVAQGLPMIQNLLLVVHIFGFLAVVVVLWVMAPHQSARAVFTEFRNGGDWPSVGVSVMVGQLSAIYGGLSVDATAHMAEEVKDAGRNVPNAIAWGYMANGILAIIFIVTYIFSIPSVEDALNDPSTFPFIYVFRNAVSTKGVNALTIVILVLVIASNVSFNASASRQTFSFARDKGLPFAKWLSAVHPKKHIPANAIFVSCLISVLLSLINLGSSAAFHAIISLNVAALMATYVVSISCVLYLRLTRPELLPHARWSLGPVVGPIVNGIGLGYVLFALFWSFWPGDRHVTVSNFNWSIVIFSGVVIISLVMYFVQGRKTYTGPVTTVVGRH